MPESHFARVAVDEERWIAFRQAALARGLSISGSLGRLVEAELKRREALGVGAITAETPAEEEALAVLAAVRASIDELEAIARRLAPSAVAHGRSWEEVGRALRIDPRQAERAYGTTGRGGASDRT